MSARKRKKKITPAANRPADKAQPMPSPTASELIAIARLLPDSALFPSGVTQGDKEARELLFRHAAQVWTEAEEIARTYRENGAHAASLEGWVDSIVEARAQRNRLLSQKECVLFLAGTKNITRARKNLKEYIAAKKPDGDSDQFLKRWEDSWGGGQFTTHSKDPRLLQAKDHYQRWHNEQRSGKNRSNAANRAPNKPRRKKKRLG